MFPPENTVREKHPVYLFITGLCMGAADVVPGVSGGTMAFILGVYRPLLEAIQAFNWPMLRELRRGHFGAAIRRIPFRFLIPLGLGIVTSILSLAELLTYLMEQHEALLFSFFFGLVAASILALGVRHRWTRSNGAAGLVGAAVAYWIVGLVPADPGHSPWVLFASGALAICAMILPGISGSFVLLILGQYAYCVSSLAQLIDSVRLADVRGAAAILCGTVLPVGFGAGLGLAAFSRVLNWLLARQGPATIALMIGFMAGSLRRIWPYKIYLEFGTDRHGHPIPLRWQNTLPATGDETIFAACGLCLLAFVLLSLIDHLADRRNPLVLLLTQGRLTAVPTAKT